MKSHFFKLSLSLFTLTFILSSCGSLNRIAIEKTGSVIADALPEVETEANFDHFLLATPGQLKLVEGLLYNAPESQDLLYALIKSYSAYALLGMETLLLDEKKRSGEKKEIEKQINYFYQKSIAYTETLFKQKKTSYKELLQLQNSPDKLHQKLADTFDLTNEREKEILFFFAQSLGGLINFNKDRPIYTGQLPLVKNIIDFICLNDFNFYSGSCYMFNGLYETSRPTMLGGDPEKGKEAFLTGIEKFPDNLFIRALYIQLYLIPRGEQAKIEEEMEQLAKGVTSFHKKNKWQPFYLKENDVNYDDRLNLFNAVAEKRLIYFKEKFN